MVNNIVTLKEAAQRLDIKVATLRNAVLEKRLPASQSGSIWLIDLSDPRVQSYKAYHVQHNAGDEARTKCGECGLVGPLNRVKFCGKACFGRSMKAGSRAGSAA